MEKQGAWPVPPRPSLTTDGVDLAPPLLLDADASTTVVSSSSTKPAVLAPALMTPPVTAWVSGRDVNQSTRNRSAAYTYPVAAATAARHPKSLNRHE
jgi:hypothetical protein